MAMKPAADAGAPFHAKFGPIMADFDEGRADGLQR
jgi:hypothetical protein